MDITASGIISLDTISSDITTPVTISSDTTTLGLTTLGIITGHHGHGDRYYE